jgi:hypothetical protein
MNEKNETNDTNDTGKQIYSNSIDFDEASRLWRQNKKYLGNGYFRYKCAHFSFRRNAFCENKLYNSHIHCKYHYKIYFIDK